MQRKALLRSLSLCETYKAGSVLVSLIYRAREDLKHWILIDPSLLCCQNLSDIPMEDYENIIREYQNNTNATSPDPDLASLLDDFGVYLCDQYESTGELSHLQKAIEILSKAFEETPEDDQRRPERLYSLSNLFDRYMHALTPEALDGVICILQRCIDTITLGDPIHSIIIILYECLLCLRFSEIGDVADIEKGISVIRGVIDTIPNQADQAIFALILRDWLNIRFNCVGEMPDLEEAVCLGQDLVNATPLNHPERAMRLIDLAKSFDHRYSGTRDIADINEAISLAREANDIAPPADLVENRLQNGLYLSRRYDHYVQDDEIFLGEMTDLDEAIYMAFEAVEACPIGNRNWNGALALLGVNISNRYASTRTIADANSAITMIQEIVGILRIDGPLHALLLSRLGVCFSTKYEHTSAAADLDEAICVERDILNASSLDDESRLESAESLADNLYERYSRSGAVSDIEEAILLNQTIIASIPMDHPERVGLLVNLGACLYRRYQYTGATIDLDEVIRIGRHALDVMPHQHKLRRHQLTNLAIPLAGKYERTGAISDIEESILLLREAIACSSPSFAYQSALCSNLGVLLVQRYYRTKATEDLNEAIRLHQEALDITLLNSRQRAKVLHDFAGILHTRFHQSGEIADLTEAILMLQEALSIIPPDDMIRALMLNGLGDGLYDKYIHTGMKVDLEEAIRMGQNAVDMTPQNHPVRARLLISLGRSLDQRFTSAKASLKSMKSLQVLFSANIATIALVLHISELSNNPESSLDNEHLTKAKILANFEKAQKHFIDALSSELSSNFESSLDNQYLHTEAETLADFEKTQTCFIDALYHGTATVQDRFLAGRKVLRLSHFINYHKAYDVAKDTIDLIPLLMSHSLQNSDKQNMLSMAVGASSDAAAIALHALSANRGPLAAIECLETGRGLIGRALFEQYEISTLQKYNPDLADSLLALQNRLDKPDMQHLSSATFSAAVDIEAEGNRRREIEQEYSNLLQAIRLENGFEHFLLPAASESDMLHAAACGGPIVILNLSRHRCDALIIRQSGLEELALPPLLSEIDRYSKDIESIEALSWLWEDIVCPVLNALGFTEPPSDGIWPHVWWIPTGKLTKFPLHAAGHHLRRSGETTLDRVISSYATSVKAIIHTRRRGDLKAIESLDLLAVAMEQTEGQTPLVHASREIDTVVNTLQSMNVKCNRPQEYKGNVLSAMGNCQIFHFAGHGEVHPTNPLQSSLLLRDWQDEPFTVASLLETNLSSNPPFLAYLSACGTGQILDDDSIDESIHLTNAFQLAGFRHVIGTLWSVDDEVCVEIAKMTYNTFSKGLRDDVVSQGLHDAVRTLRDRWVNMADERFEQESRAVDGLREGRHAQLDDCEELGRPFWIPYVHFGV